MSAASSCSATQASILASICEWQKQGSATGRLSASRSRRTNGWIVCSDDRRARKIASERLGRGSGSRNHSAAHPVRSRSRANEARRLSPRTRGWCKPVHSCRSSLSRPSILRRSARFFLTDGADEDLHISVEKLAAFLESNEGRWAPVTERSRETGAIAVIELRETGRKWFIIGAEVHEGRHVLIGYEPRCRYHAPVTVGSRSQRFFCTSRARDGRSTRRPHAEPCSICRGS